MKIADDHTRETIADNNLYRDFNKQQAIENPKWTCSSCGVLNFARLWYGIGLIMTPRVYHCHNSKCEGRRFYYRQGSELHILDLLPADEVDELAFVNTRDPVKFYERFVKPVEQLVDDEDGDWSEEGDDITDCPGCGQTYDDADADFLICHHCGYNAN